MQQLLLPRVLQLFVLESRDADTEDRNFGPVHFGLANGSSVDLVVAAMDQGWCFAYTCQERLSSFWTYLPSKQLHDGMTLIIQFVSFESNQCMKSGMIGMAPFLKLC